MVICGRHRKIAFLVTRPVTQVVLLAAGVPAALVSVYEIETGVLVLIEAHIIKNEEFGFRAEVRYLAHARVLQIQLGLLCDPPGVALVVLLGDGIDHVAEHDQRRGFGERVQESRRRIRHQQHVAFINGRPAADAGSINSVAVFKRTGRQFADGIRHVMLQAWNIGETQVQLPGLVLLGKLQHFLRLHPSSTGRKFELGENLNPTQ